MRIKMLFIGNFLYNLKQTLFYILVAPAIFIWSFILDFYDFICSIFCDEIAEARAGFAGLEQRISMEGIKLMKYILLEFKKNEPNLN